MKPRHHKVIAMLERDEENLRMLTTMRAKRLGRLVNLKAPDFIIANELMMVLEAVEALFKKHEYDPSEDDRVTEFGNATSVPTPRNSS